jgi:predicted phage tail protein|tara:strand:- start:30 stop:1328 length:1299 start_codon:yes stop_codon:yes gene_type:complete
MQQTVRLLGDLGERYGAEHQYHNLRSPSEAIKLLCVNYPALQNELLHAHEHGIGYKVIQAGLELDYDDLALPLGQNDLIVTPVVAGSGGSAGRILAGVGLVATAIVLGPAAGGFLGLGAGLAGGGAGIISGVAATAVGSIGASLVLGGVAQMLSPQPQLPSFDGIDGSQRFNNLGIGDRQIGVSAGQSYAYNGPANVVGVGTTIPVAYGTVLVGGALLSARIEVTNTGSDPDNDDVLNSSVLTPGPDTMRVAGEKLTTEFVEVGGGELQLSEILITDSNQNNFKRHFNQVISLSKGNSETFEIPEYRTNQKDKIDIIFRIQDGLFNRIGGANSTKTVGSITYDIEVFTKRVEEAKRIHFSRTTISGLINATDFNADLATRQNQKYRYRHRVKGIGVDNEEKFFVKVTIHDFEAFLGDARPPSLKVHAVGLNM